MKVCGQLALRVFMYTAGAMVGGLCIAFGVGLVHPGTANAAKVHHTPGLVTAVVSSLSGTVNSVVSGISSSSVPSAQHAVGGAVSAVTGTVAAVTTSIPPIASPPQPRTAAGTQGTAPAASTPAGSGHTSLPAHTATAPRSSYPRPHRIAARR